MAARYRVYLRVYLKETWEELYIVWYICLVITTTLFSPAPWRRWTSCCSCQREPPSVWQTPPSCCQVRAVWFVGGPSTGNSILLVRKNEYLSNFTLYLIFMRWHTCCIYHSSILKWHWYLKFFRMGTKEMPVLHGCFLGLAMQGARSQGIDIYDINLVCQ